MTLDLFKDYAPLAELVAWRRSHGHGKARAWRRVVMAVARAL